MNSLLDLLGRFCISAIFLFSGINKIFHYNGTVQWMEGFGIPGLLLIPAIIIEIIFPILIIIGYQTRLASGILIVLAAAYIIQIELKRKEEEGKLSVYIKEKIVGKKLSLIEIIISIATGFLIGFKLVEGVLNYGDLVDNPQAFVLSSRGNFFGGLIFAFLSYYNKKKENKKQELVKPKMIKEEIHPYDLVGNITIIAAVSGIIGAKIFHNFCKTKEETRLP